MLTYVLVIIVNFILIIVCALYSRYIIKLSGKDSKDEMMKFFKEKAFKNIGIVLTSISGIFLIINLFIYFTYHGKYTSEQLMNYIFSDLKYLSVSMILYVYYTLKLKKMIKDLDREVE